MEIPRHWRMKAQRYRLEGSRCANCGEVTFPPRPVCLDCMSQLAEAGNEACKGLLIPVCLTELEPHMRNQIPERMTR